LKIFNLLLLRIIMKPSQQERDNLAKSIKEAKKSLGFSNAEIASLARVDRGQTLKICNGKFRTMSDSVARVCAALGLNLQGVAAGDTVAAERSPDASWAKLEKAVNKAWDKTPKGADRLAKVIEAVGEVIKR
jgi:hypothetical protein